MNRKLAAACLALAAFAVSALVPMAASASPELTHPTGVKLAVGSKITATNIAILRLTNAGGEVQCDESSMTGELTTNNGTHFAADITAATFGDSEGEKTDCIHSSGNVAFTIPSLPWCLTSKANDQFELRGGKCSEGSRAIKFTLDYTDLGFSCGYSRGSIPGTFKTHPEDAKLTISEVPIGKEHGGFLCPSEVIMDVTFTLETDTGAAADPIYIS